MKGIIAAAAVLGVAVAGVAIVAATNAGPTQEAAGVDPLVAQFVGNWELVSYESFRESGEVVDMNYIARITYDEHGNMSAVGMPRDLPERAAAAPEGERPVAGFGYFSTYEIRPAEGQIIHNVVGSPMHPQWVGGPQVRYYEFTDGLLKLSLKNSAGRITGTLTWRRLM